MGKAIAAELSNIESSIAEQQSELVVNNPNLQAATKNSASIAKARLLKISTTDAKTDTELNISTDTGSASIAKVRLHNLFTKESSASDSLPTTRASETQAQLSSTKDVSAAMAKKTIPGQVNSRVHNIPSPIVASANNQPELSSIPAISSKFINQRKVVNASSKLNTIKQWKINKSVTLTDILLNPAPAVAQAPDRLPDSPILPTVIEDSKPVILKPSDPIIGTQKPTTTIAEIKKTPITSGINEAITKPAAPVIETKKPETSPQIINAQKPEPQNNEPKKWAVGVHTQFSTTGFVGVDAGYKFSPNLHARLGLNTVGFNVDYASQGIDYKAKFNPTNVHLLGDYFPFGGGLRFTGGLVFQSNQFNGTGTPNGLAVLGGTSAQISLGGVNYNLSDVGTVTSEGSFSNSVAPYLGIGFGTPISPGLGFNFEAGVMFAGSPNVKLRANVPSSVPAILQDQIRASLADQERRTNNDISSFSVYPVVSVGFSYAF